MEQISINYCGEQMRWKILLEVNKSFSKAEQLDDRTADFCRGLSQ